MDLNAIVAELNKVLSPQIEAVNKSIDAKMAAQQTALDAINKRMSEIESGAQTRGNAFDEGIRELKEVRERAERAVKLATDHVERFPYEEGAPFRFDTRGRVVPQIGGEAAEWFRDAIGALVPGYRDFVKATLKRDTTQLNAATNTVGGFLVPPQYRAELLKLLLAYGQARKLFRIIPMETDKLTMPALDGEMTSYWIDENVAPTESKPTFAQFTITTNIRAVLTHIPIKLVMMSNPGIVQIVVEAIARTLAKNEDVIGFTDQVSAGGKYNGLIWTPTSGNTNSRGNAYKQALGATKTHYNDVDFDDVRLLIDGSPTPAHDGAVLLMHRTFTSHFRSKAQTKASSWYNPLLDVNGTTYLYGYRVIEIEAMPALSASVNADKPFIVFCNPIYMAFGDQQQQTIAQDASIGFKEGQIWVRGTEMLGFEATVKDAIAVLYTAAS